MKGALAFGEPLKDSRKGHPSMTNGRRYAEQARREEPAMSAANDQSSDTRNRMLGSVPGVEALGRGPAPEGGFSRHEYHHPAAGWGAARSVGDVLEKAGMPVEGVRALFVMNHEDGGFDCPGCAWPDDPSGLRLDLCENGVKHTTWELTRKQVGADFFAAHTVSELAGWSDYDLEAAGRLAEHRTFGINHRPDQQFLDRLAEVCHIDPPREHGLDVARAIGAMREGRVKVFISLGGNLALAEPDTPYMFEALQNCDLTVHVATKLNRSHIVHGQQALILPCLARTDTDLQAGDPQGVSVEDAMSMVHISHGMKEPVSADLRSECAILAGMAQATLPGSGTPWQWYVEDYDRIRDTMAQVFDGLEDFNTRVRYPHGFRITQPARERGFLTPSGRAEFGLAPLPGDTDPAEGRLMLATVRSHDQFNTTIYSNDDRYRGLKGLRTVVFMNSGDMKDRGLGEFDLVDITSFSRDGSRRTVYCYRAVRYEIPRGCAAGYMPELNVLCGIADYSTQSGQPVTKHLEVEVAPARVTGAGQ